MPKKTKAQQIADDLNNLARDGHEAYYKTIAENAAFLAHVGIYWLDDMNQRYRPRAEIFQTDAAWKWGRKIGEVTLGFDGVWRA